MLKNLFPCFLLLLCLPVYSQSEDNLKLKLKQIQTTTIKNTDFSNDASRLLDSLVVAAGTQYSKTLTKKEYDLIVANYTILVNEVNKAKVLKPAGNGKYLVNQQSLLNATSSICPLYPFCSRR